MAQHYFIKNKNTADSGAVKSFFLSMPVSGMYQPVVFVNGLLPVIAPLLSCFLN
jgi:hypothetical protein